MKLTIILATSSMDQITAIMQGADMWQKNHVFADAKTVIIEDGTDISKLLVAAKENPEIVFCGVPGIGNYFNPTIREISIVHNGILKTATMHDILWAQGFAVETDENMFLKIVV